MLMCSCAGLSSLSGPWASWTGTLEMQLVLLYAGPAIVSVHEIMIFCGLFSPNPRLSRPLFTYHCQFLTGMQGLLGAQMPSGHGLGGSVHAPGPLAQRTPTVNSLLSQAAAKSRATVKDLQFSWVPSQVQEKILPHLEFTIICLHVSTTLAYPT